ncbi:DUF3858 domain-containing protein [Marinoscillum furvescens]|uniref:Uncharacterized protein DUF3857 n=1 Tax=Marinoscillum furvescens DSM 4134 TaxID=1122208 RepID=A0A3D9KXR6_MARFU|nr:DUF3858 domain-containing protein [Marinoscillum furvescens]RED92822.1 uncharacterized protein DUF3857 [Marinoscillum furvescens DSM 4134]
MRLTILMLTSFLSLQVSAQKDSFKFGKVSKEELQMTECPFYPEANAMILGEKAFLRFEYSDQTGWGYQLTVTRRIKVFNKLEKDIANVSIVVYDPESGGSKEVIAKVKGFTYNLQDGKVVKSKLTNSEEYYTRLSKYRTEKSFAMPDVQNGSVFEYEYLLSSDFISTLRTWHFQHELPTAYSHFDYVLPEYFNYTVSQVGNVIPIEHHEENARESFSYRWTSQGALGQSQSGTSTLESNSRRYNKTARNVPPVENEPFMNNKVDLPSRLEFQLMSVEMPNSTLKVVAGSYEKFNKEIMDWSSFGKTLDKGNFAKDFVATLSGDQDTKAMAIYNWLSNHFSYNNYYGFTSSRAGRQAFNSAEGSVADINLSLVAAYREAGLNAHPVILSTRGSGLPHPVYPNYEDFNYVVAAVETSKGFILTDASTSLSFGTLPTRCLNGRGWMAKEGGGQWVTLKANAQHSFLSYNKLELNEGVLSGKLSIKYGGYYAIDERSKLRSKGSDEYEQDFFSNNFSFDVTSFEVNDESRNLQCFADIEHSLGGSDVLYINPVTIGLVTENPFKREDRMSYIDLPYPQDKKMITTITIPEGYSAELPEPTVVTLPENSGKFMYTATINGNTISIMSSLRLQRTMYAPNEYAYLKSFYQLMADKNNELIVLKKL